MRLQRALTVTATVAVCLVGTTLPAEAAAGPWKTTHRSAPTGDAGTSVASGPVGPTTPAAPAAPASVTVVDPAVAMATRIVALVNAERTAAGLEPLAVSGCAQTFAVTWSGHMAGTGDFSHQSLTPILTGCGARGAGENIAYGASSADGFMSLWMNSAGHKANILRASFTHIGVGVARSADGRWYATQDFLTA